MTVLNLVINGLPSILLSLSRISLFPLIVSFKPCYKWITFNTYKKIIELSIDGSFKPCYKWITFNTLAESIVWVITLEATVLNLVINGLPSILKYYFDCYNIVNISFKPCYKWITFNTISDNIYSITYQWVSFKPCYKWITFNTILIPLGWLMLAILF